ncbi:geranylgeranylglyceryl/heptaprenylglyceryl phosphate synthase [Flavobacterium sp.]|uniref:geranylgeranylglyceryl/heptaprenylglyceryl phosphate synthase n=1 Tax=Flavobacterium sp. TaxID=239 RepID=UPI002B4B88D5|nr:geranylgeranylglyceryl/heptaprenylglyceryl phosphate synthase [Flavobacterium sp.]HLP65812.1 geranylgeranylglyceryl/heptaprenylglyceryl phosphate synthase [Flavobacterium sp.]
MKNIYSEIVASKDKKLLAILLDPDKLSVEKTVDLITKINSSPATHIFVGGSTFDGNHLDELITIIKQNTILPVVLFPGNPTQISNKADGILFLTLLSGRNPDYLIEHQINAVPFLKKTNLEIISTGYILIESGSETAVQRVTKTQPIDRNNIEYVIQTAQAGELIGNKLIYLEAGSGAQLAVPLDMVRLVRENTTVPLIVGGGIRSQQEIKNAFEAGADMVVIGTAFENDAAFFENYQTH